MNLTELLKRKKVGFGVNTPFHEIVQKREFLQNIYKADFERQIESAPDKEAFLNAKIKEFELFFFEERIQGVFSRMGEVADLLRIGFESQRVSPSIKIYPILSSDSFKKCRIVFRNSFKNANYLQEISKHYQGLRVCDLNDEDEKTFEAFCYVIEGGNFAMVYKFLKSYKIGKKRRLQNTTRAKASKSIFAYQWESEVFNIDTLYKGMKGIVIDKSTKYKDFERIFSGEALTSNDKPIKLCTHLVSELLYLIYQLQENRHIAQSKRFDYVKMRRCFVDCNGEELTGDLAQLMATINTKLRKAKRLQIDRIINQLKPLEK